jgi:hypothetical protein
MIDDILKNIPDDIKLSEVKSSDEPTLNLIKTYKEHADKNSKLPNVTDDTTGAEFKQALNKVDPSLLLMMLSSYQNDYLEHTGQACETEILCKKTKLQIVLFMCFTLTITISVIALIMVVFGLITGDKNTINILKELIDFFQSILKLFFQQPEMT